MEEEDRRMEVEGGGRHTDTRQKTHDTAGTDAAQIVFANHRLLVIGAVGRRNVIG